MAGNRGILGIVSSEVAQRNRDDSINDRSSFLLSNIARNNRSTEVANKYKSANIAGLASYRPPQSHATNRPTLDSKTNVGHHIDSTGNRV